MDFDVEVKLTIYRTVAGSGRVPRAAALADRHGSSLGAIRAAFARLRAARLLVLDDAEEEIRMAPPFSAVPTSFVVRAGGTSYFANCVWDAYGVAAALGADADVATNCGCCEEPMAMGVRDGAPVPLAGIAHFAVPAARWWDDIVHT